MNYVREYWRKIESGEIVTSRRVKAVYGRLMAEMDSSAADSPYYFDEETVERFCKQSQGTLGAPLRLELFQKAFIQTLFGWLLKETGYRRFRETLFLVGRKNGKSTLLAALALYMLVADYEGAAEIYSVATKKDQARKTLTEAVNMVKQSPELRAIIKKRRNDIYFPATASTFEALASDSNTLDGLNSHAVIIDELHAIRDRNLYEVMKQSTSSRRQPLVIMITTSGTVRPRVRYSRRQGNGGYFPPRALRAGRAGRVDRPASMDKGKPRPRDDKAVRDPRGLCGAGKEKPGGFAGRALQGLQRPGDLRVGMALVRGHQERRDLYHAGRV